MAQRKQQQQQQQQNIENGWIWLVEFFNIFIIVFYYTRNVRDGHWMDFDLKIY